MPLMRPPHYNGILYNRRKVKNGELVDVLKRDVEQLLARQWELVEESEPAGDPSAAKPRASRRRSKKRGAAAEE